MKRFFVIPVVLVAAYVAAEYWIEKVAYSGKRA